MNIYEIEGKCVGPRKHRAISQEIALLGEASVAPKLLGWTPLKQQFGRVHDETQSSSKQFLRGCIIIGAPFHEQFNHFCFLPYISFR